MPSPRPVTIDSAMSKAVSFWIVPGMQMAILRRFGEA
jgi:hypothetical protein